MRPERLESMWRTAIAYDRETHRIQPGLVAPPPVLGSAAELMPDGHEFIETPTSNGKFCMHCLRRKNTAAPWCIKGVLLDKQQSRSLFAQILDNPEAVICGANIAYDMLVEAVDFATVLGVDIMPKIMMMYDPTGEVVRGDCDGRVFEVQLAEGLHAIAQGHLGKHALSGQPIISKRTNRPGRYALDVVTFEVTGREDAKVNDRFREGYAQFDNWPLKDLPWEAQQYPVDDAYNTLEDALGQAGHLPSVHVHEVTVDPRPPFAYRCKHCEQVITPSLPQACYRKQRRRNLHALSLQAYFAWAAHLGSAWGLNVPQEEVDKLEARIDAAREASIGPFKAAGFIRENGTECEAAIKRAVAVAYGARDLCPNCNGTGKVPSPRTNGKTKINCKACDGTCLLLVPSVPRSPSGEVGTSRDVKIESGDELLMEYGEQPSKKIKTTYIPLMRRGRACNVCGFTGVATKYKKAHEEWCTAQNGEAGYRPIPLIVKVDPLKSSLRAAIEEGLHSMPRTGGVRECFCARPGYVYSSEDYAAGELVTLSDALLRVVGWSKLAEALNGGLDPHLALAGTFCSKTYEQMAAAKKAKEAWLDPQRQVAKKSNFGFGGGMAELEFVLKPCRADPASFTPCPNGPSKHNFGTDENPKWVRGFNGTRPCIMMDGEDYCGRPGEKVLMWNDKPTNSPVCIRCLRAGQRAREMWFAQWPEMRDFFKKVKAQIKDAGPSGTPEIAYPELITRGGLGFCDAANNYFQMSLAKAAKAAFCQIQRECVDRSWRVRSSEMMQSRFDGIESPLVGSRAILLFHDETLCEHPESVASEAAIRVSEIMVEALRFKCPKMYKACKAEPTLMRKLYKGAEPVWMRGLNGDKSKPADDSDRLVCWEPKKAA